MPDQIPDGITRDHIVAALRDLERGAQHPFGDSTGYDVLFEGRRYPPKALIGIAAGKLTGTPLGPYDFKGGLGSRCFRVLAANGFDVVAKGDTTPFPDEISSEEQFYEGAVQKVVMNRYERDAKARAKAIAHYGFQCLACGFDFEDVYGTIGQDFIHVHHTVPVSTIGEAYKLDPVRDLRTVCPNCHAMLHKREPPFTVEHLQRIIQARRK